MVLIKGNTRGVSQRDGNVMTEAEIGVMCLEDGGRGHKSRNTGGH